MIRQLPILILVAAATARAADPDAAGHEFFEKKIRPLLIASCFECHGPEKKKGHLRMDSRAAILAGGETGPAAIVGNPAKSLLVEAIHYRGETQMPPKAKLGDAEIAALETWIKMGLPWPGAADVPIVEAKGEYVITPEQRAFWSFQPIKSPASPSIKNETWPRSPIDRFILAGLEAKNLTPAAPAERRALIRRASYDLTGLPPSPEEIDAFLKDTTPDAFKTVIDRLLASPRYGERWGRHWLDVVRYADARDARGIGGDADIGEAWRYRDWVIDAFNRDLPYDQFVIQQIAGDLLPPTPPETVNANGLVATGLLTIGEWGPGDADKEKMMTDIVDDQIDVVGRAFMGLTVACARCHDHKFDPIPTADYYSLAGIFFSTHIIPAPGKKTDGSPMLRTPLVPKEEAAKVGEHTKRVAEFEKRVKSDLDAAFAALPSEMLPQTEKYIAAAYELAGSPPASLAAVAKEKGLREFALKQWIDAVGRSAPRPPAFPPMLKNVRDVAGNPGVYGWRGDPDCPSLMVNTNDNVVSIGTLKLAPKSVSVHPGPNAGVALGWRSPIAGAVKISGKVADADSVCGDGIAWAIDHHSDKGAAELASGEIPNGGTQAFGGGALDSVTVQAGDVIYLQVLPKGEYTCDTTGVELSIESADGKQAWRIPQEITADPLKGNPRADGLGHEDVWRFCDMAGVKRTLKHPPELARLLQRVSDAVAGPARADAIRAIQKEIDTAAPTAPLIKMLTSPGSPFAVQSRDEALLSDAARAKLAAVRAELDQLKKSAPQPVPVALAAQEGGVPGSPWVGVRDAPIMVRGSYSRPGKVAPRRFPRIIAGDAQEPLGAKTKNSGRLELAKWIASPEHPLTARVMANRVWQYHFGEGIVRSPSNFGKLGDRPTHPELLDHLARRLIENGWSLKALHREIMLSATYQQSTKPSKEALATDPDNRLFGRMNRRRLEAEPLRDSLLAVAGALELRAGGPSDRDPLTRRRMVYLMSIRSDRSSFGPLFDAADPTNQTPQRTLSTVAPQALYLLDNAFVTRQSAELAKRLVSAASDDEARIEAAYRRLYGREPLALELSIGLDYLKQARAAGRVDEKAWMEYAHVLLCANEFTFVD